ncbi:MAG: hypothetical protein IKM46_02295 [Clostridia bacterium]|nr:hypothetical protein [Clostridia bacterium]
MYYASMILRYSGIFAATRSVLFDDVSRKHHIALCSGFSADKSDPSGKLSSSAYVILHSHTRGSAAGV